MGDACSLTRAIFLMNSDSCVCKRMHAGQASHVPGVAWIRGCLPACAKSGDDMAARAGFACLNAVFSAILRTRPGAPRSGPRQKALQKLARRLGLCVITTAWCKKVSVRGE